MQNSLSVGILCYGESVDVVSCTIQSVLSQAVEACNIFVVSNRPEDDFSILAAKYGVRVANALKNRGYTGGNNLILEALFACGYAFVLLCNPDIELKPGCINSLLGTVRREHADVLGGVELSGQTSIVRSAGASSCNLWTGRMKWIRTKQASATRVTFVQGAMVFVARNAWMHGLKFDDDLFMYCDELDFGLRARALNLNVYVDPVAEYLHYNEHKQFGLIAGYYIQRNRCIVVSRYGTPLQSILFGLYLLSCELPLKVLIRAVQGKWAFIRAFMDGAHDGLSVLLGLRREALNQRPVSI